MKHDSTFVIIALLMDLTSVVRRGLVKKNEELVFFPGKIFVFLALPITHAARVYAA